MNYEGTVQNGVVVLAGGQTLPEGTVVHVLPQTTQGVAAKKEDSRTIWEKLTALGRDVESEPCDLPPDLAANHDHYLHGLPSARNGVLT
jgi:hypothetical protein